LHVGTDEQEVQVAGIDLLPIGTDQDGTLTKYGLVIVGNQADLADGRFSRKDEVAGLRFAPPCPSLIRGFINAIAVVPVDTSVLDVRCPHRRIAERGERRGLVFAVHDRLADVVESEFTHAAPPRRGRAGPLMPEGRAATPVRL